MSRRIAVLLVVAFAATAAFAIASAVAAAKPLTRAQRAKLEARLERMVRVEVAGDYPRRLYHDTPLASCTRLTDRRWKCEWFMSGIYFDQDTYDFHRQFDPEFDPELGRLAYESAYTMEGVARATIYAHATDLTVRRTECSGRRTPYADPCRRVN